jgi:hypothetical protein
LILSLQGVPSFRGKRQIFPALSLPIIIFFFSSQVAQFQVNICSPLLVLYYFSSCSYFTPFPFYSLFIFFSSPFLPYFSPVTVPVFFLFSPPHGSHIFRSSVYGYPCKPLWLKLSIQLPFSCGKVLLIYWCMFRLRRKVAGWTGRRATKPSGGTTGIEGQDDKLLAAAE